MLNWFSSTGKPVHLVLTKSDKLTRQESAKVLLQVKDAVADLPHCSVQLFSSLKKQGVKELDDALSKWLLEPDVEPDEEEEVFDE